MLNKNLDRAPYINKIGMMCTHKNGSVPIDFVLYPFVWDGTGTRTHSFRIIKKSLNKYNFIGRLGYLRLQGFFYLCIPGILPIVFPIYPLISTPTGTRVSIVFWYLCVDTFSFDTLYYHMCGFATLNKVNLGVYEKNIS